MNPSIRFTPTPTDETTDVRLEAQVDRPTVTANESAGGRERVEDVLAELDALVGLTSVKVEIRKVIAVQRLNAERRERNLPAVTGSAHLVFTGDPGTGKTTVARLVARLYGAIGLVTKGQLIEAARGDLVAGYVGQTALKVGEVVNSAIGGVLFIDEAYALSTGEGMDFGGEAVATLVKLMEDNRENLAVIVAGYRAEMWGFIRSNPGLRSRFTQYVDFANYDTSELTQIFKSHACAAKVRFDEGLLEVVTGIFEQARTVENFGNARFVRSTFELAYANMAARAVADDRIVGDEIDLMIADDIPRLGSGANDPGPRIGFQVHGVDSE